MASGDSPSRKKLKLPEINTLLEDLVIDSDSDIIGDYDSDTDSDIEDDLHHDDSLPNSSDDTQMKWKQVRSFKPYHYKFDSSGCGINSFPDVSTPYEHFKYFCNDKVISLLVREINNFYITSKEKNIFTPKSRVQLFQEVTSDDIHIFLALTMLMTHMKKQRIEDYWSKDILIETPVFSKYMARNKYQNILKFLHFSSINASPSSEDRLWKVRTVMNLFQESFKNCMIPNQKVVIDESLILFKGRLHFKQYIPNKRHRFGIKLFVICDCKTGVVLDVMVYTGRNLEIDKKDPLGFSGAIVKHLISPYLDKGRILYTDNWYTSPTLSMYLHQKNTGSCGTVRSNRKHFPKFIEDPTKKLQCLVSGPLLSAKYKDKRDVHLLSTVHEGKMIASNKINFRTNLAIEKPDIVMDYNKNMRLVDKSDMQINAIDCLRKTIKWYKKLFFHMLDISILNAHHIYTIRNKKQMTLREFSLLVTRQILEKHGQVTMLVPHKSLVDAPDRLSCVNYISRHHLAIIGRDDKGKIMQRSCHVCYNSERFTRVRKAVTQWCRECKIPLCTECFTLYHTISKY